MKTNKLMLSLIAVLGVSAFSAISAHAATYYVRDGGGDNIQCTGTTNLVYPGSGSGLPCAFNHPAWVIGVSGDRGTNAALWNSGDTLYIDGDSDINPGQQALYPIGYGMQGSAGYVCNPNSQYTCQLLNIPAGLSASQPTSIIGTGTHKPQLYDVAQSYQVLTAYNDYITLQNLEITAHTACAYNNPKAGCQAPHPYYDGIVMSGTGFTFTNVYVHGMPRYGIVTGQMGSATFTNVWAIGNGFGGISFGNGGSTSITGTLIFNQPIVEWNGCVEAYPVTGGIDNPANYSNCFGQASGGYGDGLAFGASGGQSAGTWYLYGPGSISFNTQDGLDTLHGAAGGPIYVDKMRFEGNGGQQVKANGTNFSLTNSIVIADCGWWYGAPQSLPGGMQNGDSCRAFGDAVLFNVTNNSVTTMHNNTIISNGGITLESKDIQGTGCNGSTQINVYNNIVHGGYAWWDDTAWQNNGGNSQTTYTYNDGNDGNGAGTCGNLTWNEDYNIVDGTKKNNQGCNGSHDKCGVAPGFAGTIPMGTAGGAANTFYQGNAAASLISLSSSSPAIAAGATGLNYWNNGNDFHNAVRTNPPSIGGLEQSSCAVNSVGCFYNSDCCSGTCTNFVCGTGGSTAPSQPKPQPVVSITNPQNGSSVSDGSNVMISAAASEANGTIANISIYNGAGVLLGSGKTSPYNFVQTNVLSGNYTYTAQATDANGVSVTSSPVTVTVSAPPVLPSLPVVTISSPGGSIFTAGSNVTITATASETNGTISKISIYNGAGLLLGSSNSSSYNYVASNLLAGVYTFTAQATDANGVSVFSVVPVIITVSPPIGGQLSVSLTSPINNASYTIPASLILTASASDSNFAAQVTRVDFYNGSAYLGASLVSPYRLMLINVPSGNYNLIAKVTDSTGATAISPMVSVTVGSHIAPTVSLTSPSNNASYIPSSNIVLTANASETNGMISKVMFYNGSTLLGTAISAPYSVTWSNVAAGNYNLTAVAYDTNNNHTTSTPVAVTVSSPHVAPTVSLTSPVNNASYTLPVSVIISANATAANATVSRVDFYDGSTLLGSDTSSPYALAWNNMAAGVHHLTAVVTDSTGATSSSSIVSVSVNASAHLAPVVNLTSPINNASYTLPTSIVLTANATATNATVSRVDFYNGATLLGSTSSSPYTFVWSNVPAGTYSLIAVVTDSTGATASSSVVSGVVNFHTAPTVTLTSPANNASYTSPASIVLTANAVATNATVSKVDFYNGATLLGTSASSPYSFTWNNVAAGSYNLTAVATDSTGAVTSSSIVSVTVTVTAQSELGPVVTLTSPVNNASMSHSILMLTASVSDSSGKVSRVDYYNGNTYVGTSSSSPYYRMMLINPPTGVYHLTAKVTDSNGVSATAAPVTATLN